MTSLGTCLSKSLVRCTAAGSRDICRRLRHQSRWESCSQWEYPKIRTSLWPEGQTRVDPQNLDEGLSIDVQALDLRKIPKECGFKRISWTSPLHHGNTYLQEDSRCECIRQCNKRRWVGPVDFLPHLKRDVIGMFVPFYCSDLFIWYHLGALRAMRKSIHPWTIRWKVRSQHDRFSTRQRRRTVQLYLWEWDHTSVQGEPVKNAEGENRN